VLWLHSHPSFFHALWSVLNFIVSCMNMFLMVIEMDIYGTSF